MAASIDPGLVQPGNGFVDLSVRLTPRGGSDRVDGIGRLADGRPTLLVRVRAVPEDGKANQALERLLAGALGLPASRVSVARGHTARLKAVRLSGDPSSLTAAIDAWLGRLETPGR